MLLRFVLRAGSVAVLATLAVVAPLSAQTAPATSAPSATPGMARVRLSVATRALQRGDTLRAADIATLDTSIVWRWSSVAPDTTPAQAGWVTRRAIAAGEVLRAPAVGAPPMVTAGRSVAVIYQDGPVRIYLTGVATNSAPYGAAVGVRIDPTRRLDGIAVAPNTVRLR